MTAVPNRHAHNLPSWPSSFIGRERELAEVKRLVISTRLLTLTGAGGCGKTRLAVAVADHVLKSSELRARCLVCRSGRIGCADPHSAGGGDDTGRAGSAQSSAQ